METLGEFLKHGREDAGLSLEDLAGRTRIRIENLQSLEREDLEALPTDAYVRGFVKLVCRELGLEPSDGLLRYETLARQSGPPDEMTWEEEARSETSGVLERALGDPDRIVRWVGRAGKWGGLGLAAVLALTLLVVAIRWIDPTAPRARGPVAFLEETAAGVPAPELIAPPSAQPEPEPEPVAVEAPAEEGETEAAPARAPADDPPRREATRAEAPARTETPAPAPEREAEQAVAEAPARPSTPPAERVGPPATGSRLVLRVEALRPVDVTVMLDGAGHPRRRRLNAGETKTWKADRLFVLSASDGGAVRLALDDQDLGPAGPDGETVIGLRIRPR